MSLPSTTLHAWLQAVLSAPTLLSISLLLKFLCTHSCSLSHEHLKRSYLINLCNSNSYSQVLHRCAVSIQLSLHILSPPGPFLSVSLCLMICMTQACLSNLSHHLPGPFIKLLAQHKHWPSPVHCWSFQHSRKWKSDSSAASAAAAARYG